MPGKRADGKVYLGLWIPQALRDRLDQLAASRGTDRAAEAAAAVTEYLDRIAGQEASHQPLLVKRCGNGHQSR
jgi:hypothetical protein